MKIKGKFLSYISEEKKLRKGQIRDVKNAGSKRTAAVQDAIYSALSDNSRSDFAVR